MKRPNATTISARSLKVSLLATLGVYMALSSSHWTTAELGQINLPSEMARINDDLVITRGRSGTPLLSVPAAVVNHTRASNMAGMNDIPAIPTTTATSNSVSSTASVEASTTEEPSESALIIEICEKKFNAIKNDENYTFTEVMETECTNCAVTSYTVAVQAENIVQTLEEVAINAISNRVCEETRADLNPALQASSSKVVDSAQAGDDQEELAAWDMCGEQDDIVALQCYADVLGERRGEKFITEILSELGDSPNHMQFLNAVKSRMSDVDKILEKLVKSDDELVVGQIAELSRSISNSLDKVFQSRKFKNLARGKEVSTSLANLVNNTALDLVRRYQSWASKGEFRAQELSVQTHTAALSSQAELLRRQMVGMTPENARLVRGFMTSYMSTISNPRYYVDGYYRAMADQHFQIQIQMLNSIDPHAAALTYQWQVLAQEGLMIRHEVSQNMQQILQAETNPSVRTALMTSGQNVLQGINNSFDLTRNDLYDPYFMSFEMLNLRAGMDAGRTEATQFHTQPVVADTISTLPGNSQYQGITDDLLNARTGGGGTTPATTTRPGTGRVSY
jgi:hypothetical protein